MRNVSLRRSARNLLLAASAAAVSLSLLPAGVAAAMLDVCPSGCTYSQLTPALVAAHDGDTITLGAGTYTGGVAVTRSVRILGAGAGRTVIKGGGPVVTIGTYLADAEPTVSIDGVTITGGVTTTSQLSVDWVGAPNVIAGGGGVEIPPSTDYGPGATVRITDSTISGNRSTPTATLPIGPACLGGRCSFAWAKGGGIDNWGALTLTSTTVSDNLAAGVASDADGGAIDSWWPSSLTIHESRITGNRAIAAVPNGRYAEGGGIFTDEGIHLTITDSSVSGNTASLTSTQPFDVGGGNTLDLNANGAGIHVGDGSTVSILRTAIDGNLLSAADPYGRPYAFDAGLHPGDGQLTLRDGSVSNNRTVLATSSSEAVGPSGTALDLNGPSTVSGMHFIGNATSVSSQSGLAWATGGAIYSGATGVGSVISDSVISGNTVTAVAHGGQAIAWGGGVINEGVLALRDDFVKDNTATAVGPSGVALGGGVYNGLIGLPDPPLLTLNGTTVTGNRVTGTAGITLQGGGIFSTTPVTRRSGSITGNRPDNCIGC